MECFAQAIITVLEHEGGFANHPSDPGGATNFGISLRWLRTQGLLGDVDDDGDVDIDDIMEFTVERARQIYREHWWDKYGYDRIKDCEISGKVMDIAVNAGGSRSHKILQRALNGLGARLAVDGVLGPLTLKATNIEDADDLLASIRGEQVRFYEYLISKNPSLAVFRKGWLRRASA